MNFRIKVGYGDTQSGKTELMLILSSRGPLWRKFEDVQIIHSAIGSFWCGEDSELSAEFRKELPGLGRRRLPVVLPEEGLQLVLTVALWCCIRNELAHVTVIIWWYIQSTYF